MRTQGSGSADEPRPPATINPTAVYYDGLQARRREVNVRLGDAGLELRSADGGEEQAFWPWAEIRCAPHCRAQDRPLRLALAATSHRPGAGDARLSLPAGEPGRALADRIVASAPRLCEPPPFIALLRRRIGATVLAAAASLLLILYGLIPLLSDQFARAIPADAEIALGDSIVDSVLNAPQLGFTTGPRECRAPAGWAALAKMQNRLEAAAEAHVPIQVIVANSPITNAIALPGGYVILFRGLIEEAASPEEIAGVFAHEIAHVIARDPTKAAMRAGASFGLLSLLLGDAAGGVVIAGVASALLEATDSRSVETAADEAAIEILRAAGVTAAPTADFFDRLLAEHGDNGGALSSHPPSAERAERFRQAATRPDTSRPSLLTRAEWRALQRICES